jgi:Transcriptional activator of glycolytic enzymes
VAEVWREWKEGIGENPAVERLEAEWGARWRPDARMRKWFSRRKVIWDRLGELIATGHTAGDAVDLLESLRNGRSLNQLVKLLQSQRARRS